MSSVHWRMQKQIEPFRNGSTRTERIKEYLAVWRSRCYSKDIPDSVPGKVMKSMRAPSYQAVAMCLLRNDHKFHGLGFSPKVSDWYGILKAEQIDKEPSAQEALF